jgi:hypothetical protein
MDLLHAHQAVRGNSKRRAQPTTVVLRAIVLKGQIARRKGMRRKLGQVG